MSRPVNLLLIIASLLAVQAVSVFGEDGASVASSGTGSKTAWMVTAIIFIILFVISLVACIYLCVERRRHVKQFYQQRQRFHGGGKSVSHYPGGPRGMEGGDGYL